jgi:hypothetical protein
MNKDTMKMDLIAKKKKKLLDKLKVKLIQEQDRGEMRIEVTVNELVWIMNALKKDIY